MNCAGVVVVQSCVVEDIGAQLFGVFDCGRLLLMLLGTTERLKLKMVGVPTLAVTVTSNTVMKGSVDVAVLQLIYCVAGSTEEGDVIRTSPVAHDWKDVIEFMI